MLTSLNQLKSDTHRKTDVCIVGTGPAGITLALELIDSGLDVIVLESGNLNFDQDTQNLYAGEIRNNLPPIPLNASRLRYFGGTSNHWAGHSARLDERDFEKRSWMPDSGWPIRRADLEPFYKRAQKVIELGPDNYDPEFWEKGKSQLFDFKGTPLLNCLFQMNGLAFGIRYRKQLEQAKNVQVIFDANLTRIHANESFNQVTGLEVRSLKGHIISIAAKRVVLACGGVENARLLINSSFDKKLENIGRFYSFHPRLETARLVVNQPLSQGTSPYDWREIDGTYVRNIVRLDDQKTAEFRLPNYAALFQLVFSPDSPGYGALKRLRDRLKLAAPMAGFFDDVKTFFSDIGETQRQWMHRHGGTPQTEFSVVTYMDQIPNRESRVVCGEALDALGNRKAELRWQCFDVEREMIRKFNEKIALGLGAAGVGRMRIDPHLTEKEYFEELMRQDSGGGHQMGTTRMSLTAADGVVDTNCKLHGIANLYCAGSSVFPTTSWINPTMTIVALALRLAAHLKKNPA